MSFVRYVLEEQPATREAKVWSDFLKTVTYKDGWAFYVTAQDQFMGLELRVTHMTEDRYDRGSMIQVVSARMVPPSLEGQEQMARFLMDVVRDLEMHEVYEWLRVGGKWVRDPHPERRKNVS